VRRITKELNSMTITSFRAALTAGLLLATASGALMTAQAADKSKGPVISKDVGKALMSVQDTNKKGDFAASLVTAQAAAALPTLTPYDKLMINRFIMTIQVNLKDMAAADVAAEAAADTDAANIPDDTKADVYKAALQLALIAKHKDKAAKYAKLYLATTPPPSAADQQWATQQLILVGDYSAVGAVQKNIDAALAAGKAPNHVDLDNLLAAQINQKDEAGAEKTLELRIAYYNQPEDWRTIFGVCYGERANRDIDIVYLGRLMLLVDAKPPAADASLYGGTASHMAFYGDAVAAQKVGGTGYPAPGPRAAADRKTIAAQIAAGQKLNGEYNVKLAEALYGYGMYGEAETAARLAQSKGGAKDASEPAMVIAMSQTAEGKYADAVTTFGKVTSGSPATPRIVRLWTSYAKFKAAAPASAPAPAPAQ
jgi:hypothetical protein